MRRIALALAAAVLGSGCIVTDSSPGYGDLNVYWEFVRTKIATGYPTVLYDPVDQAPTGTGSCVESGVDTVRVTFPDGSFIDWDCRHQGVQGVTAQQVPAGSYSVRVTGYRGANALYDSTQTVSVPDGGVRDATVQVAGIPSNLAVNAHFLSSNGSLEYATCTAALVAEVSYSLVDWAGTVVATGTVNCSDPTPPGVDFVNADALDRDRYAIRMQGFASSTATTPDFDSASTAIFVGANNCVAQEFSHYADGGVWDVDLYDVTGNATLCQ
jgi:hypothetical protein